MLYKAIRSSRAEHKLCLWNRANFDDIRCKFSTLSIDYIEDFSTDTPVEELRISLCNNLKSVLDELVPTKIVSGNRDKLWISRTIKQLR